MATTPALLFDDKYKGPRYRYGLELQPPVLGKIPDGFILYSYKGHPNFHYGTIDYPFKLSDDVVARNKMTIVEIIGEANPNPEPIFLIRHADDRIETLTADGREASHVFFIDFQKLDAFGSCPVCGHKGADGHDHCPQCGYEVYSYNAVQAIQALQNWQRK